MNADSLAAFRASLPPKLKILFATPCDDGHKLCFWNSLRLLEKTPDPGGNDWAAFTPHGDSLVTRGRNNITDQFLFGTDFDYLCFGDSDTDFLPSDYHRLISHRVPIICGCYAVKEPKLRWCMNSIPGEVADPATGLQKVATAGTGCYIVHRSVFLAMIAAAPLWPHWKIRYIDDHTRKAKHHLWAHVVIDDPDFEFTPRDMSEDWSFSYFARKLGFDVLMDTRVIVLHEGSILYPLECRRLSAEEVQSGQIAQPDGSQTPIGVLEKV